jgi:hypothetical protein
MSRFHGPVLGQELMFQGANRGILERKYQLKQVVAVVRPPSQIAMRSGGSLGWHQRR